MSRIGKLPIAVPENVQLDVSDAAVNITGPLGSLQLDYDSAIVVVDYDAAARIVKVSPKDAENTKSKSLYPTIRTLLNSYVSGVCKKFTKTLEVIGIGYTANVKGDILTLSLGYSHDIKYKIPSGIAIEVSSSGGLVKLVISGIDKALVGSVAAVIIDQRPRKKYPYKVKGIGELGKYYQLKESKKKG